MKNKIILLILGMFLISFTSAISSGECSSIEFPNVNDVSFQVANNSSDMNGFNWDKNGTTITYCFDINFKPDNFTLSWNNTHRVEVKSSSSSSGTWRGTPTKTIEKGMTKTFYKNTILNFNINSGNSHKINIQTILNDSVVIEIHSEPIVVTLNLGEEKKISVEDENYYDLLLRLDKISNNKVELFVKEINEKIIIENEEEVEEIIQEEENKDPNHNLGTIIIIIILILVFFGIIMMKPKD